MALFESYERRIDQINAELAKHGISSIEEAEKICKDKGLDVYTMVKEIQPICFENACWAYIVGAAIAIKDGVKTAAEAAEKKQSVSHSWQVTSHSLQQRALSVLHVQLTRQEKSR